MNNYDSLKQEKNFTSENIHSRFLSAEIRRQIKTELRYRYGSIAEWARMHELNYGYVSQALNGVAPGHNIRILLEKEGLLQVPKEANHAST
ncbi:hypothetical protein [Leptospira licerasiae]|nr:hypothetical protein [Leptospira licerasiae]